jgi:ribosomal protein S18 acetylase RimI-like enzyme
MVRAQVVNERRTDGTPRRAPIVVDIVSPAWEGAVGPAGTLKKQFTAHVGGAQVGRLLVYREVDGRFDISGIGVREDYQGRRVATQLLDFAFLETGADHLTLSTGTTGDGTQLVLAYGEGRREGRRVLERPPRLVLATRPDRTVCPEGPDPQDGAADPDEAYPMR